MNADKSADPGGVRPLEYRDATSTHSHDYLGAPVLAALRSEPSIREVLDAGCGNGSFAAVLQATGFVVSACDLSASGIQQARQERPDVQFAVASVYDDLQGAFGRTAPFDAVVALEVIEHLYSPRDFLARARAALRPGGVIVLSTPYHGYVKNLALALAGRFDDHFTALWDGGHIKFWSRRTLTALLVECGFEPLSFRGAGRLPWLWKSMILTARRAP